LAPLDVARLPVHVDGETLMFVSLDAAASTIVVARCVSLDALLRTVVGLQSWRVCEDAASGRAWLQQLIDCTTKSRRRSVGRSVCRMDSGAMQLHTQRLSAKAASVA